MVVRCGGVVTVVRVLGPCEESPEEETIVAGPWVGAWVEVKVYGLPREV